MYNQLIIEKYKAKRFIIMYLAAVVLAAAGARQKNLCKRREAVVKETGANQRISQAGHSPA